MDSFMNVKLTQDGAAAVDQTYFWRPIDKDTPRGTKLQLIHRPSGVAVHGPLFTNDTFWTHWTPLPSFKKE